MRRPSSIPAATAETAETAGRSPHGTEDPRRQAPPGQVTRAAKPGPSPENACVSAPPAGSGFTATSRLPDPPAIRISRPGTAAGRSASPVTTSQAPAAAAANASVITHRSAALTAARALTVPATGLKDRAAARQQPSTRRPAAPEPRPRRPRPTRAPSAPRSSQVNPAAATTGGASPAAAGSGGRARLSRERSPGRPPAGSGVLCPPGRLPPLGPGDPGTSCCAALPPSIPVPAALTTPAPISACLTATNPTVPRPGCRRQGPSSRPGMPTSPA